MKGITVVSGVPRSGTSMLMSALQAGGHPLAVDQKRPPDAHNPRGYFEMERVKKLEEDGSWLYDHQGCAIKIIYRLLYYIPSRLPAKVLFMERNLSEVVASQNTMLGIEPDGYDWATVFQREIDMVYAWLDDRRIDAMSVNYHHVLEDPLGQMGAIVDFLKLDLDVKAMAAAVDPSLYRHREEDTL